MLARFIIILTLVVLPVLSRAGLPQLSNQSEVVLFTCTPGQELYAGFGHSALWIHDPATGVDRLYNYGTFDFNTPNFYGKFIRGKLDYMLTVTTVQRFLNEYQYRKIGVTSQKLHLHTFEIQSMFQSMEENLQPENRFYKYDFFYDNCATRIRDVVVKSVDGNLDFNTRDEDWSFREILFPYLTTTPWTKFGINLILGLSSDVKATPWDYQYMPELMQLSFASATIEKDGTSRKLVMDEQQVLPLGLDFRTSWWHDPALFFGMLFLITVLLTVYELRKGRYFRVFDLILNSISVLAGLFLFFMWVGTDHSATNYNLNILWLLPAQALFLIAMYFQIDKRRRLVMVSFFYMVVVSLAMHFWPQESELSFLIIALIYALRYLFFNRLVNKTS
jgi:hypothetical protein